jgi:hypothetical protein
MQISYSFSTGLLLASNITEALKMRILPDYDEQVLDYALSMYKPAIVGMGWLTLSQFADEIAKCWSIENPQNAEVCRILRKYSE